MASVKNQVEYRKVSDLVELAGNPRTINKSQFNKLKTSIQNNPDYFEARPLILSDRTGELVVLAGNQRLKAAKALGLAEVPTVLLSGLSEEREKEIIIRDNVENGEWDFDALANEWDVENLKEWGADIPKWDEDTTEYQKFVDKFKPKLTTDDCFTPPKVYDAVLRWVKKRYSLNEDVEIIRPFKPEGDYQGETYPNGSVVVDNPPFSIITQIVRWYSERGIKFFLFSPGLMISPTVGAQSTLVIVGTGIRYENGAEVPTNFLTNIDGVVNAIETAPELTAAIVEVNMKQTAELTQYIHPRNMITACDVERIASGGRIVVPADEFVKISNLDGLKEIGKSVYGGGGLISDAVAERIEIEKKKIEKKKIEVRLSKRELDIVDGLNSLGGRNEG